MPDNVMHPAVTIDDALACISAHCGRLGPETTALHEAAGRVLAQPVTASEDQPPFDRSSVDGYAVRRDDRCSEFRVVDRIRAGDWKSRTLAPGEAVQIATGAAVPAANLQVIMKEDVEVRGDAILVQRRDEELNIRFRGEDTPVGAELVSAGTRLTSGALALLASAGHVEICVTRLPSVLHVATGNEIVPPDQMPGPGQIRDSNSTLVRTFLAQFGIAPRQLRLAEDEGQIQSALQGSTPDLLLISGGASVGEHDCTKALLQSIGYEIHISRTASRPGKPLIFGTRGGTVAFGLPGNPLAHFVCLNLYVRAALHRFSGEAENPGPLEAALSHDFDTEPNQRETLWPARTALRRNQVEITLLPWRSSGDLTSLATANALARIPAQCKKLSRGAVLRFEPTGPLL